MTIREKFNSLVSEEFGGMQEPILTECEKIADDYAIDFVEWICEKGNIPYIKGTLDTTLKIFKTEKGL